MEFLQASDNGKRLLANVTKKVFQPLKSFSMKIFLLSFLSILREAPTPPPLPPPPTLD